MAQEGRTIETELPEPHTFRVDPPASDVTTGGVIDTAVEEAGLTYVEARTLVATRERERCIEGVRPTREKTCRHVKSGF